LGETPKIYVLNLDRHPDRLANIQRQMDHFGLAFIRFPAIDAKIADPQELDEYVDRKGPIPRMGASARAVTAGHFRIWKAFLETDAPVAFILEDDVRISESFPDFLRGATQFAKRVDILNFNRQDSTGLEKKLILAKKNQIKTDTFVGKKLLSLHFGAAGYMVSRTAAQNLCAEVQRTDVPIDHLLFNPNVSKYARGAKVYQSFPAFVEPDKDRFETSIQDEYIPESTSLRNKLFRAYYEVRGVPSIAAKLLTGRAEIQVLKYHEKRDYR